ncbi:hypothetical protein AB4059_04010 [Lysobacter sp. 2RAF19]
MNFDRLVADHQAFFATLGSLAFVNGALAYGALFRLRREHPARLQAAGIIEIDGWLRPGFLEI